MNLFELKEQNDKNFNIKKELETMIYYLDKIIFDLEIVEKDISVNYVVDNYAYDNSKISVIKKEVSDKKKFIVNNIIPKINQDIENIIKQIEIIQI